MSEHATAGHGHAPHWEVSVWPLVISFGILFAVALAFAAKFVYHNALLAVIFLGLGVPMILAGIVGWVKEGISGHGEGLAFPAMGWFIVAEAMIFVSFFANYWFMRLTAPYWPPTGTPVMPKILPMVMTVTLVASSFTIHYGEHLLAKGNRGGFVNWLLITIALGVAFMSMSAYEWNHLIHQGFVFDTNAYSTVFYTITGFHGGHVLVGLCIFLALLFPVLRGKVNEPFVKTAGIYWHFVDIVWFFVVSQVYYW